MLVADKATFLDVALCLPDSDKKCYVVRHVPVLPPYTSVIVAHGAARPGNVGVLGATYDHRVLSGFDVAQLLTGMSRP